MLRMIKPHTQPLQRINHQFQCKPTSIALFHTHPVQLNKDGDRFRLDVSPDELNRIRDPEKNVNEIVSYKTAGLNLAKRKLDPNFKKGVSPIYTGPYLKQISMAKRVSLGFGIVGVYVSKILFDIDFIALELSYLTLAVSVVPYPLIQYVTSPYVISIHRIYDRNKPQTLENLVEKESFIFSKLNYSGSKAVDNLVHLESLKIVPKSTPFSSFTDFISAKLFGPRLTWQSVDPDNEINRLYYVHDNTGGVKMDRIWAILEKQSGIDNGRSFWTKLDN